MLTEVLLEVTSSELKTVAKEVYNRAKNKAAKGSNLTQPYVNAIVFCEFVIQRNLIYSINAPVFLKFHNYTFHRSKFDIFDLCVIIEETHELVFNFILKIFNIHILNILKSELNCMPLCVNSQSISFMLITALVSRQSY